MDDLLRVEYRAELDRPEAIRRELYLRASSDESWHTRRIRACLEAVESSDGSGVHLEFCIAGMRKNSYMCAVWPRDDALTGIRLRAAEDIERLTGSKAHITVHDRSPPLFVRFDLGGRTRPFREYVFFEENPHLPHRPFYGTWYDAVLDQSTRDEAAILAYHLPRLKAAYDKTRSCVDATFAKGDMEALAKLHQFVERLQAF